jgi:hypothetical protein
LGVFFSLWRQKLPAGAVLKDNAISSLWWLFSLREFQLVPCCVDKACGGPTNNPWQSPGDYMEKITSTLVEVSVAEDGIGMLLRRQSQVLKVEAKRYMGGCELLP